MQSKYNIIYVTCSNYEEARKIAEDIVLNKYAACVNIIQNVESLYMWENKLSSSKEVILFIKTTSTKISEVIERIKSLHSYECPCIISINIGDGEKKYLKWIENSVNHDIN